MAPHTNLIALSTADKYVVVSISDIICCTAEGSYVRLTLREEGDLVLSKGLSKLESFLPADLFVRIHNKTLVNILHVRQVLKGEGGAVLLSNGAKVNLAERRRKVLMERLRVF
ncbi:MAG: LytTR family transcriptional regulator [Lewinellaceae bacterium]|nr:LytTR family transcriptional regulator [Saprospiraceae bacterium]MCB9340204.1 LytTR family transcriptional regulator [Lewinellaceae bacterium]